MNMQQWKVTTEKETKILTNLHRQSLID